MISTGCDPTSNYLKSNLHFLNINSTLRVIWYDQIILLDSGD
ncbi:3-hydroxyacyl-CoA dehydrogenase [Klebsiella aerogenes]|nr:3-hydroxyacyl-CoA dehydrogenase [Klebsiella aerogenes]ATX85639.1 3-hydroxyacyl-CoA dehydrogenase [Klebsiella aerogenes]ATY00591.1 3-hydroxyacyl-CoA dehydrogenase [Klebsiella aerogenes]ATY05592.1 3-hydroxyacyl-CoA dehydrogenase [Klebsiella aerogenes]AUY89053.1 3-hydroxyacyl-CoA dehydrogenase [Klebsiella aerogenes]